MLADAATYGILAEEERREKAHKEATPQEDEYVALLPQAEPVMRCTRGVPGR